MIDFEDLIGHELLADLHYARNDVDADLRDLAKARAWVADAETAVARSQAKRNEIVEQINAKIYESSRPQPAPRPVIVMNGVTEADLRSVADEIVSLACSGFTIGRLRTDMNDEG